MTLITAKGTTLKIENFEHSKKDSTGINQVALQMSLGYELCHQAKGKLVPEIYNHFH